MSALWVRDDRSALLLGALMWLLVAYLLIPPDIFTLQKTVDMAANPVTRAIKLGLIGISFIFIVWRASLSWLLLRRMNAFFLMFMALVPISYLWSIDPSSTLARYVSLVSVVMVCFAFCLSSWHTRRFQNVLRPILTILLFGSLIFGFLEPDLAIEHGTGTLKNSWHGLTSQKNQFGQLAAIGVILWLHAWLAREVKTWPALIWGFVSFYCLILSRSSTSLLSTVFVSFFMVMLLRTPPNLRRYMPYIAMVFAGLVLTYAISVLKLIPGMDILLLPITAITGKDMTFSNRSEIWIIIKEHIALSPYIGTGYGAYWIGPVPWSPSYTFLSRMYFYPTESHNGYLEIVNDLGFLGFGCLFGYLITYVNQCLQLMRLNRVQAALFLGLFFQQSIMNLSETTWLSINAGFTFTIMTAATISLARILLDHRLMLYYGRPAGREMSAEAQV